MKFYLDVSCLDRPFDDQYQERVRLEAEAVRLILQRCEGSGWRHVSSQMAVLEIDANPDHDRLWKLRALLPPKAGIMSIDKAAYTRAAVLAKAGLGAADAVHVATAEAHAADVLLTCDDRFLRRAGRMRLSVRVANPVVWLREQANAQNT